MIFIIFYICLFIINSYFLNYNYDPKEAISKTIETDISSCNIVSSEDTHGGFLGDGDYFVKLKCNDNINVLNWKELPLSDNIYNNMKIECCNSNKCLDAFSRFKIPILNKGYYKFIDRNSESTNKYDDTNLNKRSSFNYSVAIYDNESNIIYYYELDT